MHSYVTLQTTIWISTTITIIATINRITEELTHVARHNEKTVKNINQQNRDQKYSEVEGKSNMPDRWKRKSYYKPKGNCTTRRNDLYSSKKLEPKAKPSDQRAVLTKDYSENKPPIC